MRIFSSRLVRILIVLNLLILITGVVSFTIYDEKHLPEVGTITTAELLTDMSQRQQRSPVQIESLELHPIFHQNRTPYIVKKIIQVKQPPAKKVIPLTSYQLKGIVYNNSGNSFAILLNKNSKQSFKLKVGESFDGWLVKTITRGSLELTKGSKVAELKLINTTGNR